MVRCALSTVVILIFASIRPGPTVSAPLFQNRQDVIMATAPEDTMAVGTFPGGAFYVDKSLVTKKDFLQRQIRKVEDQYRIGEITLEESTRRLKSIRAKLKQIEATIEKKKTKVEALKVFKEVTKTTFPLSPDKRIIISADNVRLRPADGDEIICELEKQVLASEQPAKKEFDQIVVRQEVTTAKSIVGKTESEFATEKAKLLKDSNADSASTKNSIAFLEGNRQMRKKYQDFQGYESNLISLEGLAFNQGNKNLSYQIRSVGGGARFTSTWQRQARLTVYIPKQAFVAVRGCGIGVDIADIECKLMLTSEGSVDNRKDSIFEISNVTGDVQIEGVSIQTIKDVVGNLTFNITKEPAGTSTQHGGGSVTIETGVPLVTRIDGVDGNLDAYFLRSKLGIANVSGQINIQNDFGSTTIEVPTDWKTDTACRVFSHSGEIKLTADSSFWGDVNMFAFTRSGSIQTDVGRERMETAQFTTGWPRRNWSGFRPTNIKMNFDIFERPMKVVSDEKRPAGFDLVSLSGRIEILKKNGNE